jgi:L-alanine-DL-glutamate epimerase-like enolase superfamily enzyme
MSVTRVTAQTVRIPVSRPTRMSNRILHQRDFVTVAIETDESDHIGIGYVYAGTTGGRIVRDAVTDLLSPTIIGQSPDPIFEHWERMYQETLLSGRRGAVVRALSAIDIALWDLSAKRKGVSLAVLLGGNGKAVSAYASGGYYRSNEGPWNEAIVAEIRRNQSQGFRDHKIKVGGLSVAEDSQRVAAAVKTIGADGRLALDANNAYRNVVEALYAIRAFERAAGDVGLWWIEEPLSPDDVEGHRQISQAVQTPIATGEIHQTRWEFRHLIERQAADILQPDAGVLGGVSEWVRVARVAETFGIPIAPHWHANLHVHLASASTNCIGVEYFALEKDIYNFELLVTDATRLAVQDGHVSVPARPGIGIEFDEASLQRFAIAD